MIKSFLWGAFLLASLPALAQNLVAFREAPLMGSNSYFLNGTALLEEFDDGTFRFRLSNDYSTNSGPDVQIYLTNNGTFASPIDLTNTLFIEDVGNEPGPNQPGISHFSGPYSKVLPTLNGLSDFDHVVFVCVRFGQLHWGHGSFDNPLTNIEENDFSGVKLYPNPAQDLAVLDLGAWSELDQVRVEVYSLGGTRVMAFEHPAASRVEIDLRGREAGLYFVRVNSIEGSKVVRLLKR